MDARLGTALEELLRDRRAALLERAAGEEADLAAIETDRTAELVERGQNRVIARLLARLDDRTRREIDEIDAALDRMRVGDYGRCSACGQDIGAARLRALPAAALCLRCAEQAELRNAFSAERPAAHAPSPGSQSNREAGAHRTRLVLSILILVGVLLLTWQRTHRAVSASLDEWQLGPETWERARTLLPDGILERYRQGDYRNAVLDADAPDLRPIEMPPDFRAASIANRGRFALDDAGSIVDVASGERPPYVMGFPFPDVSADDPAAATKIVWNYFYGQWYRGNAHYLTRLVMLNRSGVERELLNEVSIRLLDGAPEARGIPNPHGLSQQMLARVVAPADLAGTVSLTWRYRDASPDSVWTYVPGLRRARSVSPLNRSDGFLGSDMSLDDGPFFDAKPETFQFRLLARRDGLVLVDPFSLRGEADVIPVAGGGWRSVWKDVPQIGADDPEWTGVPWAPVSAALLQRPIWVVEARPRDPNYLYGRLELYLDAETYAGAWVLKFDWADALIGTYQVLQGAFYQMPDGSWMSAGGIAAQIAENRLYDRATVARFPPRSPSNPADYRVPLAADDFSPDVLVRLGR